MKFPNYLAAIFLCSITFISCTDEFDLEFPAPVPPANIQVNLTLVPLNPTEQKLRGEWFWVMRDSVNNDSVKTLWTIKFTEFARPGQTLPELENNLDIYTINTRDEVFFGLYNRTYQAPDSSTLIIYLKGGVYTTIDSAIRLQITRLEPYILNLRDSQTGKEWKFVR